MNKCYKEIVALVKNALVEAGSTLHNDKKKAYLNAIESETNENALWALETLLENAKIATRDGGPICDDTGIPHLILEVGPEATINGQMLDAIREGVKEGLRELPGRPMSVMGEEKQRIEQSCGLNPDSGAVDIAPILLRKSEENRVRLHILMLGGGPEIRAKTYRVFHQHSINVVIKEIVEWAKEGVAQLGCSPCTLAIGIGRSHYEATALMLQAQIDRNYDAQSSLELEITKRVNDSGIGPMGLSGSTSVLATFLKIGPQRASGVRIVCVRPCCCFEPRFFSVDLA